MSRDWTPREFDIISIAQKYEVVPTIDFVMYMNGDTSGEGKPMFSDEEKTQIRSLPKLSCIGIDFLMYCIHGGIYGDEKGRVILQQLNDYFANGTEIPDKELEETAKLWYDGQLEPGYDLTENDREFVAFIRRKCKGETEV